MHAVRAELFGKRRIVVDDEFGAVIFAKADEESGLKLHPSRRACYDTARALRRSVKFHLSAKR
jgi:hypothetical protein